MLSFFKIRRTFYNLEVSVTVDVDAGEASLTLKKDKRIIGMQDYSLRMHPAWREPRGVDAWLSEQVPAGHDGTMGRLEAFHHRHCRLGLPGNVGRDAP